MPVILARRVRGEAAGAVKGSRQLPTSQFGQESVCPLVSSSLPSFKKTERSLPQPQKGQPSLLSNVKARNVTLSHLVNATPSLLPSLMLLVANFTLGRKNKHPEGRAGGGGRGFSFLWLK